MYATLTGQQLEKVQALEKELGMYVLANPKYKQLKPEQVQDLNEMEKKLGAVLIAYES
jgi:hypothetical protein